MPSHRKPTAAQIQAAEQKRAEVLEKLADGIDSLTTSDAWKSYLDCQAKFHRYSFTNTLLILCQNPAATRVASFKKWQELERHVVKGETSIRIWAPRGTPKAKAEAEKPEGETEPSKAPRRSFVLVPVFDVSQTEGKPLPEPVHLLEGEDQAGMFGKLTKVAESIGYQVDVTPEIDGHPGANGLCEYGLRKLTVAGNRSAMQQVKSLTHEIAHAMLHEPPESGEREATRGQCELEAESTAYVVGQSLGIDTSDYSFGYVAGWSGGDADKARATIKTCGGRISGASQKIFDELEAQAEKAIEAEVAQAENERRADRELELA
jgi:antirestriction protein ArdC